MGCFFARRFCKMRLTLVCGAFFMFKFAFFSCSKIFHVPFIVSAHIISTNNINSVSFFLRLVLCRNRTWLQEPFVEKRFSQSESVDVFGFAETLSQNAVSETCRSLSASSTFFFTKFVCRSLTRSMLKCDTCKGSQGLS